jgi:hypothetical protein
MRSHVIARGARRPAPAIVVTLVILVLVALAACAPSAPADGPVGVVGQALARVAAKDVNGMRGLACAGQEDLIRDQLGLGSAIGGGELLPDLDTQALLDAVAIDVGKVKLGDAVIDGDVAQVPVTGTVKVTFDAAAMKPILKQVLEQRGGTTMTDEQLDALLKSLASYGQDVPLDQSVRLVRESGAWKICQDTVTPSAAS